MPEDRLSFLSRSPRIVESAVRATLAETLALRRLGAGDIDARSFGNRALVSLSRELDGSAGTIDALGRHELEIETIRAAAAFFSSKIGRRILTIDATRLQASRKGIDVAVHDARNNLHVVRIEIAANDADRVTLGRRIYAEVATKAALHEPRVHLFSLRDARLRSYSFTRPARAGRRVA